MKKKHLLSCVLGGMLFTILPSCTDDSDSSDLLRPTALVTVCPNADGSFVMQLDDETQLVPTNIRTSPFGTKEVRALVNYTETDVTPRGKNVRNVEVNWLDSIRTKLPVASLGEEDVIRYGNDPVEIVRDWVTVAEDGYITLRIRTLWGEPAVKHNLNLVADVNPENPYEFDLRHDAKGDMYGYWGDALIAFNLNNMPKDDSGIAKIKLNWNSFEGEKSAEFELKMRSGDQEIDTENIRYTKAVE